MRFEVSVYIVYITNQFQTIFAGGVGGGRGGGLNLFVEVTANSKEKNLDFCPNYVQEFGLRSRIEYSSGYSSIRYRCFPSRQEMKDCIAYGRNF